MRCRIVMLALVATPFIADVSAAQGKSVAKAKKDECSKPGLRTGHESIDWILKHFDRSCQTAPPPTTPPPTTPPPTTPPPTTPPPAPDTASTDPVPEPSNTGVQAGGALFLDYDWSRMPAPDEPRLSGWTVQLLKDGVVVKSATTDADGAYNFTDLSVGSYMLCVVLKAGFMQVPPIGSQVAACPNGLGLGYKVDATMTDANVINEGLHFPIDVPAPTP